MANGRVLFVHKAETHSIHGSRITSLVVLK